jgi:signal transduction histidine kinase/CheY-like chemotaxis protein/HAMP domain-containing protein
MKISNVQIKTQLLSGFALLLIFVIVLGVVGISQSSAIASQTRLLYDHPLQVRRAIGKLEVDVLSIHRDIRSMMLTDKPSEIIEFIAKMDTREADAFDQIDNLYSRYLGPKSDVDSLKQEFIKWNAIHTETRQLFQEGKIAEAIARTMPDGEGGKQAEVVFGALEQISNFQNNKADELYASSQQLSEDLNRQFIIILGTIVLLTLVINYFLMRNIRIPLNELTRATRNFKNGKFETRSAYGLTNEFGVLSESFNEMAEILESNLELNQKTGEFSNLMLAENDPRRFFKDILNAFTEQTNAHIAAVYLLNGDGKTYEHFESIGLGESAKKAFFADTFEGEFGKALVTQKIQHITGIAADNHFTFYTVSGKFTPQEIITIPVVSNKETIAVLSLATIGSFDTKSMRFINEIWNTLNARVTGILAFRQIQSQAEKLEEQNRELDAQKRELTAQSGELNQQNKELEMQKAQLSEASRLKTSFISNMSHELRTPLNSVIALSAVLGRRLNHHIPDEEYSYLEVIERNGKQLLALINDILDLSRIEAGREDIEISQFDLNDLVEDVFSVLSPLAKEKHIALWYTSNPDLSKIVSDYGKCRHILQNVTGNAVKFTDIGRVEIIIDQIEEAFQITVRDTGIGIAESDLPRIFDEFRQADGSASRKYGGTGLGLAIAKKYAELLGGNIGVESRLGEGSSFTITLPLRNTSVLSMHDEVAPKHKSAVALPVTPISSSDRAKITLLLVEDSEPAIIQMKDMLEESAYRLLIARNGKEALEMIPQTHLDAIILDLIMPEVDGFKVLKTIRDEAATTHLPVLILTAKYITKKELKFLEHNNIHQLIQKGAVNRTDLLSAVDGMVRTKIDQVEKPQPLSRKVAEKVVVLVVEDNPDNMLTAKALLGEDFIVIEASDGEMGIELAKTYVPDLILMDIALPQMDGIQVLQAIKKDARLAKIKMIALTASAMTNDRETILAYGFDGYIAKPIDQIEFTHTIRQVLYGKN